jgi:hypothetical protein
MFVRGKKSGLVNLAHALKIEMDASFSTAYAHMVDGEKVALEGSYEDVILAMSQAVPAEPGCEVLEFYCGPDAPAEEGGVDRLPVVAWLVTGQEGGVAPVTPAGICTGPYALKVPGRAQITTPADGAYVTEQHWLDAMKKAHEEARERRQKQIASVVQG